jgi:lysophospholipase L1-like esterase
MRIIIKILLILLFNAAFSQNIDCVGSSITANGYPRYTNDLMIKNKYVWRVHNYGVAGAGVVQNAYADKQEYGQVLDRKSEIVLLLLGANDWVWYSSASQDNRNIWEREYINLVSDFMKNSKVFLGLLIHRVITFPNAILANSTMDLMNVVIKKIAQDYNLTIIDFTSAIGTDPANFWVQDGLHPNNQGSELLGIAAYEAIDNETALSIDDEYLEAVKDYEEQKKIGWFGCQP